VHEINRRRSDFPGLTVLAHYRWLIKNLRKTDRVFCGLAGREGLRSHQQQEMHGANILVSRWSKRDGYTTRGTRKTRNEEQAHDSDKKAAPPRNKGGLPPRE